MDVDPAEFRRHLAKGLGRAHLVLERRATEDLIEALIAACLKNLAYDPQVEGSRARYLFELVQLADATPQLVAALEDLLVDDPDDHDVDQRAELTGILARDGAPSMRDALYRAQERLVDGWLAERPDALPSTEPARQIVELDGARGAVFVFGQLGRIASADPDFWDDDELVRQALGGGDPQAETTIAAARARDRNVDAYLRAVERQTSGERDDEPGDRQLPSGWWEQPWASAQRTIEGHVRGTDSVGFFAWRWGEHASDDDVALAARALVDLPKDDLELLRPYLCIFRRRPFPLDPSPLIDLIDDPREKVAWFALNALERLRHPDVRAAGLRIAESGPLRERSLDLLAANWEQGDAMIAERLLASETDVDAIHTLGHGLRAVLETDLGPELVPALLLAYEWTPCSECRNHFVRALLELDALPPSLGVECRWDSNAETRQLVGSDFPGEPERPGARNAGEGV